MAVTFNIEDALKQVGKGAFLSPESFKLKRYTTTWNLERTKITS